MKPLTMKHVRKVYLDFICGVAAPHVAAHVDCDIVYFQAVPALRICPPSATRPTHAHCDAMYFHMPGQINFWLPLVDVGGNGSLWVESAPDSCGDFHPLHLRYGQCACFWGNRCVHLTMPNDTGGTRITLDFRLVPGPLFDADYWPSRRRLSSDALCAPPSGAQHFGEGGYYAVCQRDAVSGKWCVREPELADAPGDLEGDAFEHRRAFEHRQTGCESTQGPVRAGASGTRTSSMSNACHCGACVLLSRWRPTPSSIAEAISLTHHLAAEN